MQFFSLPLFLHRSETNANREDKKISKAASENQIQLSLSLPINSETCASWSRQGSVRSGCTNQTV